MAVAVVTDSAAAIPAGLARRLGITVVAMRLSIGDDEYEEGEVPLDEVVARFGEGVHTAGPSPGAFVEVLRAVDTGDGVVVLTVSERMSSIYKSARLAADLRAGAAVIDTRTAAGGQALVVLAAAQAASEGLDLDAVVTRATDVRNRVRLVAAVETLDYLVRGGRIPEVAARAGRHLGVRPLFELTAEGIKVLRPALSHERALEALLGHWRRSRPSPGDRPAGARPAGGGRPAPANPHGGDLHLAVSHALDPGAAEYLVGAIRAEVEPATCLVASFGPVMVAHTGPGVIGLAWHWDTQQ